MPGSDPVKERIEHLIAEASELKLKQDYAIQMAWLIAAQNTVQLVCPSEANPYHTQMKTVIAVRMAPSEFKISQTSALLSRLIEEIDRGLLTSIENYAIAVTFDDFLDHGEEYLKHGRKNEAGVIAGIVFEDTVRRICRTLDITEKGVALETLTTELAKRDVLTALKAKRARAAAGLRTSAAHARWEFTKELIEAHLG